jgi:hypothetical protein
MLLLDFLQIKSFLLVKYTKIHPAKKNLKATKNKDKDGKLV